MSFKLNFFLVSMSLLIVLSTLTMACNEGGENYKASYPNGWVSEYTGKCKQDILKNPLYSKNAETKGDAYCSCTAAKIQERYDYKVYSDPDFLFNEKTSKEMLAVYTDCDKASGLSSGE